MNSKYDNANQELEPFLQFLLVLLCVALGVVVLSSLGVSLVLFFLLF